MAKCLIPLSESTVGMIAALKASPDETYDAVVRRALELAASVPAGAAPSPVYHAPPNPAEGTVPHVAPGGHVIRLFGEHTHARSLSDALATVLETLSRRDAGFLERLSQARWRTRFIVARSPEGLYPGSPHLAKYARRLDGGWWMATNYSREDVDRAVRTACKVAKLRAGADVAVTFKR